MLDPKKELHTFTKKTGSKNQEIKVVVEQAGNQ
jgi:hypothetical protein